MAGTLSENAEARPAEKRRLRLPVPSPGPALLVLGVSLIAGLLLILAVALLGPPVPPAAVVPLDEVEPEAPPPPEAPRLGWRWHEAPIPAPAIAFADAEGRVFDLEQFRGHMLLVNFWATWCAPCLEEMPALDALQAQMGDEDFQVMALSVDRGGRADVQPFLERTGIANLAVYYDPASEAMHAFGITGLPTTVLIDPEGRWLGSYLGPAEWTDPETVALLQARIAEAILQPAG